MALCKACVNIVTGFSLESDKERFLSDFTEKAAFLASKADSLSDLIDERGQIAAPARTE